MEQAVKARLSSVANSIRLLTDDAGRDVVVRVGRYGPYLERIVDGESPRANLPDDLPPDELTAEIAEKLFAIPVEGRVLGTDPVTGHEIVAKEGRYGPYVTELLPDQGPENREQAARRFFHGARFYTASRSG